MAFDPEEIVTLYGHGQMTLRSAVERALTRYPQKQTGATIFRDGEPPIGGMGHCLMPDQQSTRDSSGGPAPQPHVVRRPRRQS